VVPKSQDLDSLAGQEFIALDVFAALLRETMSATVQFNRQTRFHTIKIQEVNPARIFPAKFESLEMASAQQSPEAFFGISGTMAQFAGKVPRFG
jgi:hypothetical protein